MIPGRYKGAGADSIFAPLSSRFNRNFMPFEVNSEKPVALAWFNGGDVSMIPITPKKQAAPVTDPKSPPKTKEINISRFFGGGGS